LSERRKSIPSIYHYDAEGSRLFKAITELPEYYLTRCEIDTLDRNKERIADYADGGPLNLIEFGPGDGSKARLLIQYLVKRNVDFQYVPIDISGAALETLVGDFAQHFPSVEVNCLVADYFSGIKWLNHHHRRRNLVLFLGSNIGNFNQGQARMFLRNLWISLNSGDVVLIGFDLKKEIDLLLKAYNDSAGITAEFNLNVLRRMNRELSAEFDVSKFRFLGTYDVFSGAVESYLISHDEQDVPIEAVGRSFRFRRWEPIHTEYSYKYYESDIENLAVETGYVVKDHLYDSHRYFVDSVWEVKKAGQNG
jgi:dimethylhistidine N-methyltransferase